MFINLRIIMYMCEVKEKNVSWVDIITFYTVVIIGIYFILSVQVRDARDIREVYTVCNEKISE